MFEIVVVCICLVFNGFLALIEMAFVTVSKPEIKALSKNNLKALKLFQLREKPERTLSVLQIGITVVGSLSAAVGGVGAKEKITPYLVSLGIHEHFSSILAIFFVVLPLTYLNTVLAELVPKTLALRNPMKISLAVVSGLILAEKLLSPFVKILEISTQFFLKFFSFYSKNQSSLGEYTDSVSIANLSNTHQQYVINLVHIETKKIKDIMLPWEQVNKLDLNCNLNEVLSLVIKSGHTRLPVLAEDEVIGILHSKEFITFISSGDENWKKIIRPMIKILPNEGILKTLRLMQEKKSHMVLVQNVNQVVGIVTLEDIMEEIVGDIFDEDDDGMLRKILSQRIFKSQS